MQVIPVSMLFVLNWNDGPELLFLQMTRCSWCSRTLPVLNNNTVSTNQQGPESPNLPKSYCLLANLGICSYTSGCQSILLRWCEFKDRSLTITDRCFHSCPLLPCRVLGLSTSNVLPFFLIKLGFSPRKWTSERLKNSCLCRINQTIWLDAAAFPNLWQVLTCVLF